MLRRLAVVSMLLLLSSPMFAAAQVTSSDRAKDEMGLTRMRIVYPNSRSTVAETRPSIAVDFSLMATPVDARTVTLLLDGVDVTQSADITASYLLYQPENPLFPGEHEVRITAKDINHRTIEPLTWNFTVEKPAAVSDAEKEKKDNTTGRLVTSTDYVSGEYAPNPNVDISQLFAEKEGMKLNADLFFSNSSEKRSLMGSYHRETQAYTDMEIDKIRLSYADELYSVSVGSFWLELSDLSVSGTELSGVQVERKSGPRSLMFFAGRTQDPGTGGAYRQTSIGARGAYQWNRRHSTAVTIVKAREKDNPELRRYLSTTPPADDLISNVVHEVRFSDHTKAVVEAGGNVRRENGRAGTRSGAFQASLVQESGRFSCDLSLYSVADNYLPIAEGSARYLRNNREGEKLKGSYRAAEWLTLGGEYELYNSATATVTTETRRNAGFIAVSHRALPRVTYRKSKLSTSVGVLSESESVSAVFIGTPKRTLTRMRITANWQQVDFSSSPIRTNIIVWGGGVSASWKRALDLNASFNSSRSGVSFMETGITEYTNNKKWIYGFSWNVPRIHSSLDSGYEVSRNTGSSVTNEERRVKAGVRIASTRDTTFTLGWDKLTYKDEQSSVYNYHQNIYRSGLEWNF